MEKTFKEITEEMFALYERKNKDYGNSFSNGYKRLGIISAVSRLQEKTDRIVNIVTSKVQAVSEESLRETILDLANYAVMTVMEMDNDHED